jgi:MoxR-like ATPase
MIAALEKQQIQQIAIFPHMPAGLCDNVLNQKSTMCPFHGYEGNKEAVKTAISLAKKAFIMGMYNDSGWICTRQYPVRIILTGPRSCGKTTFAKNYGAIVSTDWNSVTSAKAVTPQSNQWRLPWVELDGAALKRREEIMVALEMACRAKNLPLIPVSNEGGVRHYRLPAMVIFIDEVHALPKLLMEGILKMTEQNDGILELGVSVKVDCRAASFIIATTNPGALKDTLLSRFPIRLDLKQHSVEQVATMIQNEYKWPRQDCLKLASLKPLPREALSVAKLIEDTKQDDKISLHAAMSQWIDNLSLREGGLTDKAIEILATLADAHPIGMSKENLCASLAIEKEEFQKQLLPQLLRTATHPAYVVVAGRHKITQAGLVELRRRSK